MDSSSSLGTDELGGDLPEEYRARIKAELVPGEQLLWAERSRPRPVKGGREYLIVALIAVGFLTLGGVFSTIGLGLPGVRIGWVDVPFTMGLVLGGIGLVILLCVLSSWSSHKQKTPQPTIKLYALTDQRAIIWSPEYNDPDAVTVSMIQRGKIDGIHRVEYPDGSGNVLFHGRSGHYWGACGFENVPEVRRVEGLVRRTLTDTGPGTE